MLLTVTRSADGFGSRRGGTARGTGSVLAVAGLRSGCHYPSRMPELILPTVRLQAAFLECRDDWGPGLHEDGFGLGAEDDVDSPEGFATWVHKRVRLTHPTGAACPDEPHGSPRWIVEDGVVLGGIALRHIVDDDIGQIGYGIRPCARRRGLAGWALREMLAEARAVLGWDRVLVPCLADNVASARTIERNGGVLEGIRESEHGRVKRYWIALNR